MQRADHLAGGDVQRGVQAGGAVRACSHGWRARGCRAASAGSARCGPAPGSGSSHPRTAPPRVRAGPGTARRRRGPCRRTAGPWTASTCPVGAAASPKARQIRETAVWLRSRPRAAIDRVDQCVAFLRRDSRVLVITASTSASVIVRGRPGRGSSSNPSSRRSANRLRHLRTVPRSTPSRSAISTLVNRPAAASTIRARNANACALFGATRPRLQHSPFASVRVICNSSRRGHNPLLP